MSLKAYLNKRLADLLEEKLVVVWYDGEKVSFTHSIQNHKSKIQN